MGPEMEVEWKVPLQSRKSMAPEECPGLALRHGRRQLPAAIPPERVCCRRSPILNPEWVGQPWPNRRFVSGKQSRYPLSSVALNASRSSDLPLDLYRVLP